MAAPDAWPMGVSASLEAARALKKRADTLAAQLAICNGSVVHTLAGWEFLVCWRGQHKHCRDIGELEAHARRVGAIR